MWHYQCGDGTLTAGKVRFCQGTEEVGAQAQNSTASTLLKAGWAARTGIEELAERLTTKTKGISGVGQLPVSAGKE